MNAALFLIIGCAVLVVGYIFYGGWLAKNWAWITPVRLLPIPWRMARIIALPRLPC